MYCGEEPKRSMNAGYPQGGCVGESPRDNGELTRAINDLQDAINRYDNVVNRLQGKLAPITSPTSPTGYPNQPEPCYGTDMANRILGAKNTLQEITNNLESIYERVEL